MRNCIHVPTRVLLPLIVAQAACQLSAAENDSRGRPWPIHVIDGSSRGADGVRLADVNGDGLMDITTGWEEGGVTRVYLHPGHEAANRPWPAVTVGKTANVEDAVFVDLDADGRTDVVSCCEGRRRTMFVHWAPKDKQEYLNRAAWKTEPIPASVKKKMWMFCTLMQVDGRDGIDLVAGAKGGGAEIGWFQAPGEPRRLGQWKWHPICPAGWIMSLATADIDGDGDLDVVTSDRRGDLRGCRWLENPGAGPAQTQPWKNHFIGGRDKEVMFMTIADLDADGTDDVLSAVRGSGLLFFRRLPLNRRRSRLPQHQPQQWQPFSVQMPANTGTGKGVAVGDINRDGKPDIVFSCEHAGGGRSGLMWLSYRNSPTENAWTPHEISGPAGSKFDRLELLDLDGDGDPDVLTCEEQAPGGGLGVCWYQNPTIRRQVHLPFNTNTDTTR